MRQLFRRLSCRFHGHLWGKSTTTYQEGAMFAKCVMTCDRCGFEWRQLRYPPGSAMDLGGANQQLETHARLGLPCCYTHDHDAGAPPSFEQVFGFRLW